MRRFIAAAGLALGLMGAALAATSHFELKDGSVINGAIQHFEGGTYTVASSILGVVKIPQDRVLRITYDGASSAAKNTAKSTAGPSPAQIQSVQQKILGDSSLLGLIQSLQDDPDVKAILADEDIMRAVAAYDFSALQNNEKIRRLMEKPEIKAITGKVKPTP